MMPNNPTTTPNLDDDPLKKPSVNFEIPQSLPSVSRSTYYQVFITESDEIYQWASKETFAFFLFQMLQRFKYLRFFLDGITTINPCWQSVSKVDKVLNKNVPVEITDTLILHCNSIESYSKVIPLIRGSYSTLVLHGKTTWHQIKQLWHPGVTQIRINAKFEITPNEHDEFINIIKKHCRGKKYKFSIAYEAGCPPELLKKLYNAISSNETISMLLGRRGYDVIHADDEMLRFVIIALCFILPICIFKYVAPVFTGDIGDILLFILQLVVIVYYIAIMRILSVPPMDIKNDVKDKNFAETVKYFTQN